MDCFIDAMKLWEEIIATIIISKARHSNCLVICQINFASRRTKTFGNQRPLVERSIFEKDISACYKFQANFKNKMSCFIGTIKLWEEIVTTISEVPLCNCFCHFPVGFSLLKMKDLGKQRPLVERSNFQKDNNFA